MKRTKINFIVDVVAFIGFVVLTTTGILMRYILPPGSGSYSAVWGFDRHEWGGIHFWVSMLFFSVLTFHLLLHWRWIVSMIAGRPHEGSGFRLGLGVVGFFAVIALAMAPLLAPVEKDLSSTNTSLLSSHQYNAISIRGSLTLKDIEDSTGVPANYIVAALKLPEQVSVEEKIGLLKRKYEFELNEVREIVKEYKKRNTQNQ